MRKARALDCQQVSFQRCSANRGESSRVAVATHDPMARHDQRDGIATERLANRASEADPAEINRYRSIGPGSTRRNPASYLVHALVELRDFLEIERMLRQIAEITGKMCNDSSCCSVDLGASSYVGPIRVAIEVSTSWARLVLGNRRAQIPRQRVDQGARTERRVEQRVLAGLHHNGRIVTGLAAIGI